MNARDMATLCSRTDSVARMLHLDIKQTECLWALVEYAFAHGVTEGIMRGSAATSRAFDMVQKALTR